MSKARFEETRPFKDLQLTEQEKNEIKTRVSDVLIL